MPHPPYTTESKILNPERLSKSLKRWQLKGRKIVFTNGCFDLIHPGHIDYLEKAARLGDILLLGLNSDASIARIKGANRPIMPLEGRAKILAALEFVDAIMVFEEDTPLELIQLVQPDVLIKGADYAKEQIVGWEIVEAKGGTVQTIDLVPGYSSSMIIEKIQNL